MTERHQLIAYLATLAAICILVGLGAILARAPVATTDKGDVNVGESSQ